mgnify:CR=1 FL=1|tara:strand:- start:92 stop:310 length:219 start_codon:yes stop_codon:yes gene_type:complete
MKNKIPGRILATYKNSRVLMISLITLILLPLMAITDEAPILSSGDTAWMLTATALVLFMTIPGLSLFYGGQE